jgi:hypothetical protein
MAIGFECGGKRDEITTYGFGLSRKAAKTDAYRKGMTFLKARCAPQRYQVVYSVPTDFAIDEEV